MKVYSEILSVLPPSLEELTLLVSPHDRDALYQHHFPDPPAHLCPKLANTINRSSMKKVFVRVPYLCSEVLSYDRGQTDVEIIMPALACRGTDSRELLANVKKAAGSGHIAFRWSLDIV